MPIFRRSGRPGLLGAVTGSDIVAGAPEMCTRVVGRAAPRTQAITDRLEALGRLHDDGAIDDEEYERARARILASPA